MFRQYAVIARCLNCQYTVKGRHSLIKFNSFIDKTKIKCTIIKLPVPGTRVMKVRTPLSPFKTRRWSRGQPTRTALSPTSVRVWQYDCVSSRSRRLEQCRPIETNPLSSTCSSTVISSRVDNKYSMQYIVMVTWYYRGRELFPRCHGNQLPLHTTSLPQNSHLRGGQLGSAVSQLAG